MANCKPGPPSRWSQWNRQRKITVNNRCSNCGSLIGHRIDRTTIGLCQLCAGKANRGPAASNWRGGRKLTTSGYVLIYHPEPHHRRVMMGATGYILEHILVWEEANGIPLPEGHLIHHLNGVKNDNRPENLVAVKPKDHGGWTYSQCLQRRIRELECIIAGGCLPSQTHR